MAELILARLKLPFFSVKSPEAFQVMSALPLPQPSTLLGALAYGVGVASGRGTRAYEEVVELARKGRLMAARAAAPPGASLPLVFSSVVLRRFRVADKAHEAKGKGERKPIELLREAVGSGDYAEAKRIIEVELSDALYREYVVGFEILAAWVAEEGAVDPRAAWSVHRLGDTESLCTVVDVSVERCPVARKKVVRTLFPAPAVDGMLVRSGGAVFAKMSDELRELRTFAVPGFRGFERAGRAKVPVFRPGYAEIEYPGEVAVCESSLGDIVLRG
ncbi:type I-A CRISPR-associated protein Cas5a [Thermofilum pendens]|uniref:type I-A CRISPR-associated protein Cas5a n=1 Tax=Thermofilum pendens TaxID=2269 RepID=UPI0003241E5D|nr:type I-A CRISPR-associated protein Cas5a [Thermofilum pendens]